MRPASAPPEPPAPSAPPEPSVPPELAGMELQRAFFDRCEPSQQFQVLFDYLPGVNFFAKDADGRLVAASKSMLKRFGLRSEESLIGRRDHEFFPPQIADGFLRDDRLVISSGKPLIGRVEVLYDEQRILDWFVTNKLPICGAGGKIIGVMGTVYSLDEKRDLLVSSARISKVVQFIQDHCAEKLPIQELARQSGLSERHLRRQFQEVFRMSPQEFILKSRVHAACKVLASSDAPLSEIALSCGFCDQSAFTLIFRRLLGVTPHHFRRGVAERRLHRAADF